MKKVIYRLTPMSIAREGYLSFLKNLADSAEVLAYIEAEQEVSRSNFDGVITCITNVGGSPVGIIFCDFKVFGGSFGVENSKRICHFLKYLTQKNIPLILGINSIGVRIFEGKKVFAEAFKIIPALKEHADKNLVLTLNLGKALGLGAILLSLGDYVLGVGEESVANLTGPEVFKLFFGENVDFTKASSSQKWVKENFLIHQIYETREQALFRIRSMFQFLQNSPFEKATVPEELKNKNFNAETTKLVESLCLGYVELYSHLKASIRVLVMKTLAGNVGVVLNPMGEGNLIDVLAIKKYQFACNLFKKLKLPLISMVDTSGFDPRMDQVAKGQLQEIIKLAVDLLNYPHYKFGVVLKRCYGGASILSIPTFLGGDKTIVLRGSRMGVMSEKIVESLLAGSPRLLNIWKENRAQEDDVNFTDLIDAGIVDQVVDIEKLSGVINARLLKLEQKIDWFKSDDVEAVLQ